MGAHQLANTGIVATHLPLHPADAGPFAFRFKVPDRVLDIIETDVWFAHHTSQTGHPVPPRR
jgi:hypothetical protein